ncbi:unnamed protein product [Spodoptera littoralis]|uniref:Peptidase S1 domain-containing protein n=1 Tax=Spodoptera littoralis TaxID=7109 RepID=A0A9P0HW99_SPOLI|nr:unnamed protein product [Spodoptera littoralis]CAH1636553.1 unnamed protein product [Spodoptera littoralis]
MIIKFLLYFIISYPEECYTEENATYDDDEIFQYPDSFYEDDDFTARKNNEIWVPRIMNGEPAKLGDIPYQVSLKTLKNDGFYRSFCGASIIGEKKILTAAHCFLGNKRISVVLMTGTIDKGSLSDIYAVAGNLMNEGKYSLDNDFGQWRSLSSVRYSKNYKRPKHDIAVAYLDDPYIYNKYIGPIPIATKNQDYNSLCLVSGYGKTGGDKKISSEILLKGYLEIMTSVDCSELYHYNMETFICTAEEFSDTGRGDSGGPLVCSNTSDPNESDIGVLVGIARSHSPNRSSLFVRVSKYYNFITKETTAVVGYNKYGYLYSSCIAHKVDLYLLVLLIFLIIEICVKLPDTISFFSWPGYH